SLARRDRGAARVSESLAAAFGPPPPGRARDGPLPAWLVVAIGAAAVGATAAGGYATAVSRHAPSPVGHATLTVVVSLTFVGAVRPLRAPARRRRLRLAARLAPRRERSVRLHRRRAHCEPRLRRDRPCVARIPDGTARLADEPPPRADRLPRRPRAPGARDPLR